jgi:hypothetical protein
MINIRSSQTSGLSNAGVACDQLLRSLLILWSRASVFVAGVGRDLSTCVGVEKFADDAPVLGTNGATQQSIGVCQCFFGDNYVQLRSF